MVSSTSDDTSESLRLTSAMEIENGVTISFSLSMCLRYMSSTFSRSTSAFQSSWSICLQAAASFFLALLSALAPGRGWSDSSAREDCTCWSACVVWSTSSCMRRTSISSSCASSSCTNTLEYAGPCPVSSDRSTSISACACTSRRATCWLMVFSRSRRRSILVSSCCGVCATISMQSSRPTCPFSFTSGNLVSLMPTLLFSSAFLNRLECPRSCSLLICLFLKW
mmetsp:Transcript_28332/g.75652  ORF Transcript_28332/g.75652 Transcript_28332/m.75652 type:complete len:224 (-) Transcript_28332:1004-1675(-)